MSVKREVRQRAEETARIRQKAEADSVERIAKKLRNNNAFTLAETLITVLILLMVSAVVAGGVPSAANAYRKAVDAANAYSLLSTTVNALRDELSTARDVSVSGNTITYYSSDTGSQSTISVVNDVIMLQQYSDWSEEYMDTDYTAAQPAARPLVTDAAKIKGKLKISYKAAAFDPDTEIITITGLAVTITDTTPERTIVEMPETGLQIRVITGGSTEANTSGDGNTGGDTTGGNTP